MNLITYRCESGVTEVVSHGYVFARSVQKWLMDTQEYVPEVYFILHVQKVSEGFYHEYKHKLNGL